jgi:hypothetical protein
MIAFDSTSREVCTVRRVRTNTPLSVMVTMNDPVYLECAQAFARRIVLEQKASNLRAKVARVFQLVLTRPATSDEVNRDYKPELVRRNGQKCPKEYFEGQNFAFIKEHPVLLGSPHKFAKHGQSGTWVSELLPEIAGTVDELTVVKSLTTDQFNLKLKG